MVAQSSRMISDFERGQVAEILRDWYAKPRREGLGSMLAYAIFVSGIGCAIVVLPLVAFLPIPLQVRLAGVPVFFVAWGMSFAWVLRGAIRRNAAEYDAQIRMRDQIGDDLEKGEVLVMHLTFDAVLYVRGHDDDDGNVLYCCRVSDHEAVMIPSTFCDDPLNTAESSDGTDEEEPAVPVPGSEYEVVRLPNSGLDVSIRILGPPASITGEIVWPRRRAVPAPFDVFPFNWAEASVHPRCT
jgi:hypothetical protein